jgi:hypothetical protein
MPAYPYALTLTNPGAETGDTTGWTADAGSLAAQTTQGGVNPRSGSYFFTAYQSAAMEVHQDIALDASLLADVDANLLRLTFSAWQAGYSADADTGRLRVKFYDEGSTLLAIADTATYDGGASWVQKTIETFVPPGTRTIRLVMIATRVSGTYCDAYFDDLEAHLDLADKYPYPLLLANPGGESGTAGWTNVTSALTTRSSSPSPHTGGAYLHATASGAASECYQDITLPADVLDEVDAGLLTFEFAAWQAGYTDTDTGTMRFQFLDGSNGDLGTMTGTPYDGTSTWVRNTLSAAVPVGTRKIRITLLGTRAAGTSLDAYWDDLTATLNVTQPPATHLEAFVLPGSTVRMVWTADYLNGEFNIERRESGGSWSTLSVNVTPGSSVDASPFAVGEYRIANTIGEATTYSNAVTVTLADLPAWAAYDNLDLWLSARNIALADDAEIPVLYDRSGNNHDVTAVGAKPTYKAAGLADLNDLPTVYAPAGKDGYDGGSACAYGGATGLTVFVVMDLTGTEAAHHIIGRESNLDYGWLVGVEGNDGRAMFKIATGATSRTRRDSSEFSLWKVPTVLCCRYNGSTGEQSIWVNGVLDNGALDGSVPATINRDGPALDVFKGDWGISADGHVPEIIVFAEAISEAKRQAITAELLTRYDLPTLTYVDEQEVSGEQGVAYDGTYWYVNGTDEIRKYDASWSQVAVNGSPRTGTSIIHLGDPDYYDGVLYVPGNDGASPSHTYILKYAAADLSRLSVTDLGETEGSSALTVDAGRGLIWSISYASSISVVHKHNLSDLSDAGHLTLSESIPYVQGIKYNAADGMLYVAAGATATKPSLYRVDPETGTVRRTFLLAGEAESEGIDISGTTLAWHRVPSAKVVYIYDLAFGGAALPTAPTITAVASAIGEITTTMTGGGEGADTIALYGATADTDLPSNAPGAGAVLLDGTWTGTPPTHVETGLGYGVTRYRRAYATNGTGTIASNLASATTADPRPGTPAISVAVTGPLQITVMVGTPGSGADDHGLYVQEGGAADTTYDAANLAVEELGAVPESIVIDGVTLGATYHIGLVAINAYGERVSLVVSIEVDEAQLAVTAITYNSAILQLLGAGYAYAVRFQTTLLADSAYLDPIDDSGALTDASRFYHSLTGLAAATEFRSSVRIQAEEGGAWSDRIEELWETAAAPADTSKIVHPVNGEPISGFYCIQLQLAAGRSVALIKITPQDGGDPVVLPALCFDSEAHDDGWYGLLVETDLGTQLTSTFRIDNSARIGTLTCQQAVEEGIRKGDAGHIWEESNLLSNFGLGCTVRGRPDTDCERRLGATKAFLLFPNGPEGGSLIEATSQRISAFHSFDPYCTGAIAFYPHYGTEQMAVGVATHVSSKPGGGFYYVRATVQTALFTPHMAPTLQKLRIDVSAPGQSDSTYYVDFPSPVLVPWVNYEYGHSPGSGVTIELDVQRIDPNGSRYRVRAWAAGELMFSQEFEFDAPFPPGLPGLTQDSYGGAAHWGGIQIYDVCTPDEINVTRIRRLEVWSEVKGGGGVVLGYVPEILDAEDERELMGDERLRLWLKHGSPGTELIIGKRVLRTVYLDFTWEEWRVEIVEDAQLEDGARALRVEAVAIAFDLSHGRVQQVQENGNVDVDFDPPAMDLTDHITGLILASPGIKPYFVEGELANVPEVEISYQGDVPLSAVRALAAAAEIEYHVLRGCGDKYLITMPEVIGADAPPVRIRYRKNIQALSRQLDFSRLATRAYPRGGEQDGFALTIAGALWQITAVDDSTSRVTLDGDPIAFADQLNGLMARKFGTTADVEVVATFLETQQVQLASVAHLDVNDYIQFRDPDGNELLYLDWPEAIAAWGIWAPPDAVEASDVPPVDNLMSNPFLDAWPAGVLTDWAAVGSAVLEQVTDRLFHRYGSAAARLGCTADGDGIESAWHTVAPVGPALDAAGNVIGEGRPYFTIQVALWIVAGTVRLELDVDTVGDGSNIVTLPDSGAKATSNEAGVWIDSLALNCDLHELGAKRVRVRLVQDGVTAATFVLDAAQLTQTHGGAVTFYDRRASNELWRRGLLHLAEYGQPAATYDCLPLDLFRMNQADYSGDKLVLGGTAWVENLDLIGLVQARLIWISRKLVGRVKTQIRVSTRSPALVRLLQLERDRRRRRLGSGSSGGGSTGGGGTDIPPTPPPPGAVKGGSLSNLTVTLVQAVGGAYYHQIAWSHNQAVEDDVAARFTVNVLSDEAMGGEPGPIASGRDPKLEHDATNSVPLVGNFRNSVIPTGKNIEDYHTYLYRVELYDATATVPGSPVQTLEVTYSGYYLLA